MLVERSRIRKKAPRRSLLLLKLDLTFRLLLPCLVVSDILIYLVLSYVLSVSSISIAHVYHFLVSVLFWSTDVHGLSCYLKNGVEVGVLVILGKSMLIG